MLRWRLWRLQPKTRKSVWLSRHFQTFRFFIWRFALHRCSVTFMVISLLLLLSAHLAVFLCRCTVQYCALYVVSWWLSLTLHLNSIWEQPICDQVEDYPVMLFYLKFMYLYCLAFTADWLFNLKASHERGRTVGHLHTRASEAVRGLHYVFSSTVTTSFPRSND